MKRITAVLVAFVLILTTFAACGKKSSDNDSGDTASYEALYMPVLKKYKQALDEDWTKEKYLENNLTPSLATLDKTAAPAFAFLDLNGDRTPELFIGRADQTATVYDLYTVTEENAIKQLTAPATEEAPYTLTDDNRLVQEGDGYETLEVMTYYELTDDDLTPTDSYIHDAQQVVGGTSEWYHATGELPTAETEFDAGALEAITEEEYIAKTVYALGKLVMETFEALVLPAASEVAEAAIDVVTTADAESAAAPTKETKTETAPAEESTTEATPGEASAVFSPVSGVTMRYDPAIAHEVADTDLGAAVGGLIEKEGKWAMYYLDKYDNSLYRQQFQYSIESLKSTYPVETQTIGNYEYTTVSFGNQEGAFGREYICDVGSYTLVALINTKSGDDFSEPEAILATLTLG